jgi:hypothetical protein
MKIEELKQHIEECVELLSKKQKQVYDSKKRRGKDFYILEGMITAYARVGHFLENLEE